MNSRLPDYNDLGAVREYPASPMYSMTADCSEDIVHPQSPTPLDSAGNWIFKSDHMEVNLGPRLWGLRQPSYGLSGNIEGSIKFAGPSTHVELVTATLEGHIDNIATERGLVIHQKKVPLLCRAVSIYSSSQSKSFKWLDEHTFSISLPAEVNICGSTSALPPSYAAYLPGASSVVAYVLKFDMVRRGLRWHERNAHLHSSGDIDTYLRSNRATIPILYLPKSRPSQPPLMKIPLPSGNLVGQPFPLDDRVKTEKLSSFWLNCSKKGAGTPDSSKAVYLTLPSTSFTSGESIPFMLSIVAPNEPAIAKLLASNAQLQLVKRTRLYEKNGKMNILDVQISTGEIRGISETAEGVTLLRGIIKGGVAGREHSWQVKEVTEVQYVVRVKLQPPNNVTNHVPSFRHEEVVEMSTDLWGTLERELLAMGRPTPALGLASPQRGRVTGQLPAQY